MRNHIKYLNGKVGIVTAECNALRDERDALHDERDGLPEECDTLRDELQRANGETAMMSAERNTVLEELEKARAENADLAEMLSQQDGVDVHINQSKSPMRIWGTIPFQQTLNIPPRPPVACRWACAYT